MIKVEPKAKSSQPQCNANVINLSGGNSTDDTTERAAEDTIYSQISAQCISMQNSVSFNDEKTLALHLDTCNSKAAVKYCRIPGDGDCLFSTIAHQFYNAKIGTTEHAQKTQKLRNDVVNYIKDDANFFKFVHDLKNRVLADNASPINDITGACKDFLNNCLALPRCFGGMESIKAISEMLKVNIVVMNESGASQLPNFLDISATRSVLLLFRKVNGKSCTSNNDRLHYDSIITIPHQRITAMAKEMADAEKRHEQFLVEANTSHVIEIDSDNND